jgi:hypothetical protein
MKKYYMVADEDKFIWGVGKSKIKAKRDAQQYVNDSDYKNEVELQKAIECNEYLYNKVRLGGYNEEYTWTIVKDVAMLDEEINEDKTRQAINDFENMSIDDKLTAIYKILIER